ncbi:MAG: hypothetical protein L0H15_01030, partial [Nitrosospira sp.]|nr:hypothetical protein [Nitrosospira sp.]
TRALAGLLFRMGILLSRAMSHYAALSQPPGKTKSCAIIARIHETSGVNLEKDRQCHFLPFFAISGLGSSI